MGYQKIIKSAYCEVCKKNVKIEREKKTTNHILHLILSIVTFGIWLPIWILLMLNIEITISSLSAFNCSECGNKKLTKPKTEK